MDKFTVYKDIVLFLRKVFLRSMYQNSGEINTNETEHLDAEDQQALDILNALLEENEPTSCPTRRIADLLIRSKKMPPLSKNRWLYMFLEMVQADLEKINWTQKCKDNLKDERMALTDLKEAKNVVF